MFNRPGERRSVEYVMKQLRSMARPDQLEGMARFGINPEKRLGVSMPNLRGLGRSIKKDHLLALDLWKTGIADSRILATLLAEPLQMTGRVMDGWVMDFDSWDVCDQTCMNLFDKTLLIREKISQWAKRDEEFVRRAAFASIACLALHDKKSPDKDFLAFLPVIQEGALDERNYVKKAVSWALRHIGKRSESLRPRALAAAYEMRRMDLRSARWIAGDVIRELESEAVKKRLKRASS